MPGTIKENIELHGSFNFTNFQTPKFDFLQKLYIGNCINKKMQSYGLDTLIDIERRNKLDIFENYPYKVDYQFNSRGFRDREWPANLQDSLWVIGDSHVLGLGVPERLLFTRLLEEITGKKVINLGSYSAFNIWISLSCESILNEIQPKNLIVAWTHLSKRIRPDEPFSYSKDNLTHFHKCVNMIIRASKNCNVIQMCSPNILEKDDINYFLKYKKFIGLVDQIDYARDGFHIGVETHRQIANDISILVC